MSAERLCACGCGDPVPPKDGGHGGSPRKYATENCKERAYRRRRREDPERAAQAREVRLRHQREHKARLRQDPERWAEFRKRDSQACMRYLERLKQDPERWAAHRENERIRYALRREKKGLPLRQVTMPVKYSGPEDIGYFEGALPVVPLVAWVTKYIAASGMAPSDACSRLGITDRSYRSWKAGDRQEARFDVVDRILTNGEVCWWEIYDPDEWPEEYEKARAVFEPEDLETAA